MAELSDEAWARLDAVRRQGMVHGSEDEPTTALIEAGYAVRRGSATVITGAGREAHAAWARLPQGSEEEVVARRVYEQFLLLDREMKKLVTEWQLGSANPPPDGGYSPDDWKIIDRLTALDERAGPVLNRLAGAVPRFAGYRTRLSKALSQLEDGDREWLSGLACDSYHSVWWQLHEDLLVALGIPRSEDPNQ